MSTDRASAKDLLTLKAKADSLGLLLGMDFGISGVPAALSSEVIFFDVDEAEHDYVVTYEDMGDQTEIIRTPDFQAATIAFLEEAARLAGPRGRGPYAGEPAKTRFDGMSPKQVFELLQSEGRFPGLNWDELPGSDEYT